MRLRMPRLYGLRTNRGVRTRTRERRQTSRPVRWRTTKVLMVSRAGTPRGLHPRGKGPEVRFPETGRGLGGDDFFHELGVAEQGPLPHGVSQEDEVGHHGRPQLLRHGPGIEVPVSAWSVGIDEARRVRLQVETVDG